MKNLPHVVERSIVIEAERETVFRFFTESEMWAKWWGAGSTVEARAGGKVRVVHSNGFVSTGEILEIRAPELFVFTFSMQAAQPVSAEDSRVTMRLETRGSSTVVWVRHELADPEVARLMPQGWRFHFSMFANAVADEINAGAADRVDRWFALWSEADAGARAAELRALATEDVKFRDRYSALCGVEDIVAQTGAMQRFMPGLRLERRGDVRHCQGMVLAEWVAVNTEGKEAMAGTNVFVFQDQRVVEVTGLAK